MSEPIGVLDRSSEGIEIWGRNKDAYLKRLFSEDEKIYSGFGGILKRAGHKNIWCYPDGHREYFFKSGGVQTTDDNIARISTKGVIGGIGTFFVDGRDVIDMGCGFGVAVSQFAKEYPSIHFLGIDYELGKKIPLPKNSLPNLEYRQVDWRNLDMENSSCDRIMSDQGVGKYGNTQQVAKEITRIAKIGTLIRATVDRGIYGQQRFDDRLRSLGWDIWIPVSANGYQPELFIGELRDK